MTIVEGQRWRRGARREFVSYILHSVSTTQCVRGKRIVHYRNVTVSI